MPIKITRNVVNVGIVQTRGYKSNKEGIKRISDLLTKAGKKKAQIMCLPEQWLPNSEIDDFESHFSDFKKIARKYQMTIIAGAFYTKFKNNIKIVSPIISPDGVIIGNQEKIHPFEYEKKVIVPGIEARIFKTSCKFGVIICYDMVFPKIAETFVKKGAEILFSPSRIVKRGIEPWKTYVQARSLENRVPILAANVINQKFGGHSMIVDLVDRDKIMIPKISTIEGENFVLKQINLKKFHKTRLARYSDTRKFF